MNDQSKNPSGRRPIRIANCSGFFGDRPGAAAEMVAGGPIDVLTGDWLAELTMLILARKRAAKGPGSGYADTFLSQMADVLGDCLDRGIRVVSNAGGLDPDGLAAALAGQARAAGLEPRIAVVTGDDLTTRFEELTAAGERFDNLATGEQLAGVKPLTVNAYLGAAGITAALAAGADVVITGRVTDAALTIGPAAWWHGWDYAEPADRDRIAGALVAGHVIECGPQATGGNYSFFADLPADPATGPADPAAGRGTDRGTPVPARIGFPIAEVAESGESVITKHPGAGGMVSPGTVTAQLLYEIDAPQYLNPDVSADFGSISLAQVGRDRVRISGVRGLAAPPRLKVSMNYLGGFKNSITLVLTGLDIEAKAAFLLQGLLGVGLADIDRPPAELAELSELPVSELVVRLLRCGTADPDPGSPDQSQSFLQILVSDPDPERAGRGFTAPLVGEALATYPGMFPTAPPGPAQPFGVFWPTSVARDRVMVRVTLDGIQVAELPADTVPVVEPGGPVATPGAAPTPDKSSQNGGTPDRAAGSGGSTVRVPLGALVGARSGDKGGNANIGIWIPGPTEFEAVALASGQVDPLATRILTDVADTARMWESDWPLRADPVAAELADRRYRWLLTLLATPDDVRRLLPEATGLTVAIHPLPNLRAINLVITGLLGRGVSENLTADPQAKGLAERLRARMVDVPADLLAGGAGTDDRPDEMQDRTNGGS